MQLDLIKPVLSLIIAFVLTAGGTPSVSAEISGATPPVEAEPDVAFALYMNQDEQSVVFRTTAEPDAPQEVTAVFGNQGTKSIAALIYATNGTTATNGGLAIDTADSAPVGPTTWLDLEPETVELAPGEMIERTITVSVPVGTPPGEYTAALAIQTAEPQEIEGSDVFNQIIRRAAAFYITVPGEREAEFEIGETGFTEQSEHVLFIAEIFNTGNTRVYPTGTITFSDPVGDVVATAPVEMKAVYAFQDTTLQIQFQTPPPPGDYLVDIELTDPETGASASVKDQLVAAPDLMATPAPPPPVAIEGITIEPVPAADELQYAEISATIRNTANPLSNIQLTLSVSRDGELVEDFPLATSLALPKGTTEIQQRYIPAGGWVSGTYSFSLTLEEVAPGNGVGTVLLTIPAEQELVAP